MCIISCFLSYYMDNGPESGDTNGLEFKIKDLISPAILELFS